MTKKRISRFLGTIVVSLATGLVIGGVMTFVGTSLLIEAPFTASRATLYLFREMRKTPWLDNNL